jgi:hypothetical protein
MASLATRRTSGTTRRNGTGEAAKGYNRSAEPRNPLRNRKARQSAGRAQDRPSTSGGGRSAPVQPASPGRSMGGPAAHRKYPPGRRAQAGCKTVRCRSPTGMPIGRKSSLQGAAPHQGLAMMLSKVQRTTPPWRTGRGPGTRARPPPAAEAGHTGMVARCGEEQGRARAEGDAACAEGLADELAAFQSPGALVQWREVQPAATGSTRAPGRKANWRTA